MDFTEKFNSYLFTFLFHILLITNGYCGIRYNNGEVNELLNSLRNDRNLKSFQFYPVKIYLKSDENSDEHLNHNTNLEEIWEKLLRSAQKSPSAMDFGKDRIETSKTGKLLRYQHRKKMEELIQFMRERYSSTNYFYSEMKRIQSQYTIKDQMREMIDYCESPANHKVKEKILSLFAKLKKKQDKENAQYNEPTNNLVINVIKDPYNDGVTK